MYGAYYDHPASLPAVPVVQPPLDTRDREVLSEFLGAYLFPYMKFYDLELPDQHPDNFYMEREWRIYGALSFAVTDIERIIIPRSFARRLRTDLPDYYGQVTFADLSAS